MGAHDGDAHAKVLSWTVTNSSSDTPAARRSSAARVSWDREGDATASHPYSCQYPLEPPTASLPASPRAAERTIGLAISVRHRGVRV